METRRVEDIQDIFGTSETKNLRVDQAKFVGDSI